MHILITKYQWMGQLLTALNLLSYRGLFKNLSGGN